MLGERTLECIELGRHDRQTRRRAMPAPPGEMVRAGRQSAVQVELRYRAARALPLAICPGDQHDRPVIPVDEPRRHDADHALVPVSVREHVAVPAALVLRP